MADVETSLIYGEIPKKPYRELINIAENDTKGHSMQGWMFGMVEKKPSRILLTD